MSSSGNTGLARVIDRVFPRMPDFYTLVNEQCDLVVEAMGVFLEYMQEGDETIGGRVRALEKRGDELKARNIDILNQAFATPMDREDIYRAIVSVDHIANYAKTTVRELETLDLCPDDPMRDMAAELHEGALALRDGYRLLSKAPEEVDAHADRVRKAERRVEKIYRRAVAALFDPGDLLKDLRSGTDEGTERAFLGMVDMLKRREVYRHLSNAADRMARAGEHLHDIKVKIA